MFLFFWSGDSLNSQSKNKCPGKTFQCTAGKLTPPIWNVAWVDCESKMGLASTHIHNWERPLATTRVDIFGTHSRTQLTQLGCFITATVWSASCSRGHRWGSGSSQHQHLCSSQRSLLLTCLFCQPEKYSSDKRDIKNVYNNDKTRNYINTGHWLTASACVFPSAKIPTTVPVSTGVILGKITII